MRKIGYGLFLAVMASLVWNAYAAAPARKKAAPTKTTPASKSPAKTTATARKGKAATKRPSVTWRNRQMSPTQDRYREIQGALAAKGYMSPDEATGAWGPASVDALKRFQADQKIESNGKINSLSLIALGLGPKREAAVVVPPPDQAAR